MIVLNPGAMAVEHLRYSLLRGVYFLPLLSNAVMIYGSTDGHWLRNVDLDWLTPIALILLVVLYGIIGTLIGLVILGLPALIAGLLRLRPMRWLFQLSIGRPAARAYSQMLVGTFILFEACVLAATGLWLMLAPTPAYQKALPVALFYDVWLKVNILSSPWLLSSLYASWKFIRSVVVQAASNYNSPTSRASSNTWH